MTARCPTCAEPLLFGREYAAGPLRGACKVHGFVSDALTEPGSSTSVVPASEQVWRDEAALVDASQKDLEARGCIFLRIQQRDARNAGSDRRLGDAFVKPPHMSAPGDGKLLEYKLRPIKWSSPEQREAAEAGITIVVTSLEEARKAVGEI